jgi:hypothetical protein
MSQFQGDLLIGGVALRHLVVDLEVETPQDGSGDWVLSGRLRVPPHQCEWLQVERPYRLVLDDGRAGKVLVSRVESLDGDVLIVDFEPARVAVG